MDLNIMASMAEYKCKTPVIFIFFNRPQTMVKVLEQIRKVKPDKLYLVADGPRSEEEKSKTEECRRIAKEMVDWECQAIQVYAEKNMGCRDRVASGISYVLQREESAIILEDDCVPNISFFRFMDEMLERYRNEDKIYLVTGRNDLGKYDAQNYDYYFAHHGGAWGWGTWARSWDLYDINMIHWPEIRDKKGGYIRDWMGWKEWIYRKKVNEDTYKGIINTWDYQMSFTIQYHRKICIVPSSNLVKNIGDGIDATHTINIDEKILIPAYEMHFPLRHPSQITVHSSFDRMYSRQAYEKGFWIRYFFSAVKKMLKALTGKEYKRKDFPFIFVDR